MSQKRNYLRVCIWFQEWAHVGPESSGPIYPQLQLFTIQLFLDFRANFFPKWPLIFLVIMMHQVIWVLVPSRGSRVGGWIKRTKQNPARAGWPRRLALVRVTSRAENCHYQCSIVFMRQGNLSIIGTFLINSLHFPDIRG